MVREDQKVWLDGIDGGTEDAKTISLRYRQGIKNVVRDLCQKMLLNCSEIYVFELFSL